MTGVGARRASAVLLAACCVLTLCGAECPATCERSNEPEDRSACPFVSDEQLDWFAELPLCATCDECKLQRLQDECKLVRMRVEDGVATVLVRAQWRTEVLNAFPRCWLFAKHKPRAVLISEEPMQHRLTSDNSTAGAGAEAEADFYASYHTLAELTVKWDDIASRGDGVSISSVGTSIEGNNILMIRIGRTSANESRRVVINAQQHAREWAAGIVVTYIADMLSEWYINPQTDEQRALRQVLDTVEVLIVPMVNPDGHAFTNKPENRFHRKNMRRFDDSNCIGVDLNRNWPKFYNGGMSTSLNKCSDVYIGSEALSEPESSALASVLADEGGVGMHIDYHSFGQLILGPWSHSRAEPPGADEWVAFGNALRQGLARGGRSYDAALGTSPLLPYFASGVMADWSYSRGIMSATVEVDPKLSSTSGLDGFQLPEAKLRDAAHANFLGFVDAVVHMHEVWSTTQDSDKDNGSVVAATPSTGIIVAAALGGVAAIATIIAIAFWAFRRKGAAGDRSRPNGAVPIA